jgi:hypothetical protein
VILQPEQQMNSDMQMRIYSGAGILPSFLLGASRLEPVGFYFFNNILLKYH